MNVVLRHRASVLSDSLVASIGSSLDAALRSMVAQATQSVRTVDICSPHDRAIIRLWNRTSPAVVDACVYQLIEGRVAQKPHAPAVCAWDGNLTYRELDVQSTRLAQHLVALGVGPGKTVPLCFEKSVWMVVSMLAVMKSGAAFVPLDPGHPLPRIQSIIDEVQGHVVLASVQASESKLRSLETDVVSISRAFIAWLSISTSASSLTARASPDDLAYIMFTSGSTGKPKGVMIEHRSLSSSIVAQASRFQFDASSRVYQFASYTFDPWLTETLTPLTVGGVVCVPSEEQRLADMAGSIRAMGVTWTHMTPSILRSMSPDEVPSLKTLVVGGEAVPRDIIDIWLGNNVSLFTGYGPTEATIAVSGGLFTPESAEAGYIGRALDSSQLWIVDVSNHDILAPVGAIGELVISGPCLARGYLNNTTKTAEVFVDSPSWFPGQRIYKTGDLVIYRSDGEIQFLGRRDAQVKINGQRLELGEIEYQVSRRLPAGSEVVVEVIEPKAAHSGRRALGAFIRIPEFADAKSATETTMVSPTEPLLRALEELQQSLAESLPRYMVPSYFIPLHVILKSAAGKSDRKSLREIGRNLSDQELRVFGLSAAPKREPTTRLEREIRQLWASVLSLPVEAIGLDDSFFKLGGDSLSAMRVVARARNDTSISLTVADMFKNPKLVDVALAAAQRQEGGIGMHEVSLRPFELLRDGESKQAILQEIQRCGQHSEASVEDAYPCTPLQEAMFAITMNDPSAYVLRQAYRLPVDADIPRFKAAWEELVRNTPILRTCIIDTQQSGTCQAVYKADVSWVEATSLKAYLAADSRLPMRYGHQLSRCAIVREESPQRNYFVLTVHHAVYDGHSLSLLLDQLQRLYRGKQVQYALPYSNFIGYLRDMDEQASRDYWTSRFAGLETVDFPKLTSPTYTPRINQSLSRVVDVSPKQSTGVTLATTLYSAWALTLSRTCESQDVVFGLTQNGRTAPVKDIEIMAGPTMSTVPMRIMLDQTKRVAEFLEEMQQNAADMIPHEQLGMQRIKQLSAECRAACSFQNLFVVQGHELRSEQKRDLEPVEMDSEGFLPYGLLVECTPTDQGVHIDMQFDGHLLNESEADRILQRFDHVLRQLSRVSETATLDHIDFFTPQDSDQVSRWNSVYPETVNSCIHSLVRSMALSKPNDAAVCSWDASFSYLDLERLSDRLACRLVDAGVGPGSLVPVCFEKSAWAIVAMLSIMKAGGAFVPLDPAHPKDRLEQLVLDTKASVMLVSPGSPALNVALTLEVSARLLDMMPMRSTDSVRRWSDNPSDPAYVLFTSGTTGKPKGVVVLHRAICTSMASHARAMSLTSKSRVYQFGTYTFDIILAELFTTLSVGGCVCVPSDAERMSEGISRSIDRLGATWAFFTPTVLRLVNPDEVSSLETVVVGGEAVGQDNIDAWASRVRLIDGYGPTECCVFALCSIYPPTGGTPGNIGFPLGVLPWVVEPDNHNKLTPVGLTGELLLQGPTVARGYLGDAEKTAAAFIEDPEWCHDADASRRRFYKTGDLVRYNADGSLVFVSRKDSQVKINGQRTEPAEIEEQMRIANAAVTPVVILPKSGLHAKRLVAVVAAANRQPGSHLRTLEGKAMKALAGQVVRMQQDMASKLPAYMIPTVWIAVSGLPLTTSSKTDRKRVLAWVEGLQDDTPWRINMDDTDADTTSTITETDKEKQLREVIAKVLNLPIEKVSLNKSFTALGGDSIAAMQVVSRCRAFGLDASVRNILRAKSVSELATLCVASTTQDATEHQAETTDVPFELSPIQLMYIDKVVDKRFNQSFLLRLSRHQSSQAISGALDSLVRRHGMLRARFARHINTKVWHQTVPQFTSACYQYKHHKLTASQDVPAAVRGSQDNLNAQNGPVFSVDFCEVGNGEQILFLVAHHLVVDLVSWRIIIHDLENILTTGQPATATLPFPFQKWVSLQQQYAETIESPDAPLSTDLAYWQLDQANNTYGNAIQSSFTVDTTTTSALLGDCNNALSTEPVDILIGTVLRSFTVTFGQERKPPVLFTEGHGREASDTGIDLSATVGWFTTMCPIAVPVSSGMNLIDTISQVKDIRRSVPLNGLKQFASRILSDKTKQDSSWTTSPMELIFNFAGQYQQLEAKDALFRLQHRHDSSQYVSDLGDDTQRSAVFEIGITVSEGSLQFNFAYNRSMGRQDQIQQWFTSCQALLQEAAAVLPGMKKTYTKGDFSLMPWSDAEFDRFTHAQLSRIGNVELNDIENVYPATPLQQTLLLNQSKNSEHYAVHSVFQVLAGRTSAVDIGRLEDAWQRVVNRHSALRTIFISDALSQDHLVSQVVVKNLAGDFARFESDDSDALDTLREQKRVETYMYRAPHRFSTCRTSSGRVFAKLEATHAIIDGLSIGILFRDLQLAYEGHLPTTPGPLYSDFVSYLQSVSDKEALDYWFKYLADIEPCTLPALREEPVEVNSLQSVRVRISDLSSLRSFCRTRDVTLSSLIHAAWAQVLRAFTNSDQVAFGYLNAGRDAPVAGLDEAVGMFINMLVCRVNFESSLTSSDLVQQVHSDYVDSLPYQQCSLGAIQRRLGLNGQALFSSVISYQSVVPGDSTPSTGVSFEHVQSHDPTEVSRCKASSSTSTLTNRVPVCYRYQHRCLGFSSGHLVELLVQPLHGVASSEHRLDV